MEKKETAMAAAAGLFLNYVINFRATTLQGLFDKGFCRRYTRYYGTSERDHEELVHGGLTRNREQRRRKVLDVDLNDTPPNEDHEQLADLILSLSYGGQGVDHGQLPVTVSTPGSSPPVPIDVEELDDDDVIISSPRAFEQARNSSRRTARRTSVIDVESADEVGSFGNQRNQRRRVHPQPQVLSGGLYVILEGSSSSVEESTPPVAPVPPLPPPPPPPEPTFNCPVCMGPLVEEVTTKCGHIFCKGCIKAAIAAQAKCPTCRRKVTNRELIRI